MSQSPAAPSRHRRPRLFRVGATLAVSLLAGSLLSGTGAAAAAPVVPAAPSSAAGARVDPSQGAAAKPYMGWSSWSLEATTNPAVNPSGSESWLTEDHVLQQEKVLATTLKPHGYEYVNVDAGWYSGVDRWGRPTVDTTRFPHGMTWLGNRIHADGLKFGLYLPVGLAMDAYGSGATPISGTTGCHTRDIVYPDLRTTNGWDSAYQIDFSNQCAQAYVNSIAAMLADWHIDFLKLDGVGPGSFHGGGQYDNTADVAAWSLALRATGRPIQFVVSWALSSRQGDVWRQYTNGWRVDTDVECYCNTLVTWNSSVKQRFDDVVPFLDLAGPGRWNNLDALDVGVGAMDGLTDAERQTYASFWALQAAPLYLGDDLTKLDAFGTRLITNDEVIAVDQAGRPARPVDQDSQQQTWWSRNPDGSVTVGQFNLGDTPAPVRTTLSDVGLSGTVTVRDLWTHRNVGQASGTFASSLPAHGSRLVTFTPAPGSSLVTGIRPTASTSSSLTVQWNALPRAAAGTVYGVQVDGATAVTTTSTTATVGGLAPASRHTVTVGVVGGGGALTATGSRFVLTTAAAGGPTRYEAEAPTNVLGGDASVGGCAACSGGAKVGNLGIAATLTVPNVTVPRAGTYLVQVAYLDGDSSRQVQLTVNGGRPTFLNAVGTNDNDWSTPHLLTVPVALQAGDNSVQLVNGTGYMPDIDFLAV